MPTSAALLWRLAWFASALAVAAAEILPWSNFQGHSHWAKMCWIPFGDRHLPGFWLDLCQNIVLLLPFGFTGVRAGARRTQILILAALLMICGELFQVYCHNRFPSMTDVTTGTAGAWIGALIGLKWRFDRLEWITEIAIRGKEKVWLEIQNFGRLN